MQTDTTPPVSADGERSNNNNAHPLRRSGDLAQPRYDDLVERLPLPACLHDANGAILAHNRAASRLWGDRAAIGLPDGTLAAPDATSPAQAALHAGRDMLGMPVTVTGPDGHARRLTAHALLTRAACGDVVGVACLYVDADGDAALLEQLAQLDQDKTELVTMLAHELRNPLSPIMSAATLLRASSSDTRVRQLAEVVERQARQLARFVNDLLDETRTPDNPVKIDKKTALLDDVVDCALDIVADKARARQQILHIEHATRGASVLCDAERVAQALGSLLLNASDFTAQAGTITLRVQADGDMLDMQVLDSGIGIDAWRVPQLLNPYSQFEDHDDCLRRSGGLGLAMAQEICRRHGGSISARSRGIGLGSQFRMLLPILQSSPPLQKYDEI